MVNMLNESLALFFFTVLMSCTRAKCILFTYPHPPPLVSLSINSLTLPSLTLLSPTCNPLWPASLLEFGLCSKANLVRQKSVDDDRI